MRRDLPLWVRAQTQAREEPGLDDEWALERRRGLPLEGDVRGHPVVRDVHEFASVAGPAQGLDVADVVRAPSGQRNDMVSLQYNPCNAATQAFVAMSLAEFSKLCDGKGSGLACLAALRLRRLFVFAALTLSGFSSPHRLLRAKIFSLLRSQCSRLRTEIFSAFSCLHLFLYSPISSSCAFWYALRASTRCGRLALAFSYAAYRSRWLRR